MDKKRVHYLKIPLPPLETQKQIAAILNKADRTRRLNAEAEGYIDEFLKSVFLEMFGDPVTNPKEWSTVEFKSLMLESPQNGLYKPSSFYTTDAFKGVPILRIDSFYNGKIEGLDRLKRVICEPQEVEKFRLENGNLVINRVNSLEYLGKCGLVKNLIEPTVYESNMMRIKIDTSQINPVFLTRFLCTTFVHNQILSRAKKAVNQASVNQKDVSSLKIRLPLLSLQKQFTRIVENLETLKQHQQHATHETEELFNALMQKAFNGELVA